VAHDDRQPALTKCRSEQGEGRMNFSLRKKSAGLAKAGRLPMAAAAAIGASLIFGTGFAHALTEGFDIKNNSNQPWSICTTSSANAIDSGPGLGQTLAPGAVWHVEVIRFAGKDNFAVIKLCTQDGKVAELTLIAPDALSTNPTPSFLCGNYCYIRQARGDQITIVGERTAIPPPAP
jgi:hypothetical protein